ncbi:FAD-binding oxidoreductase [Allosphingosinicella flava]|uniref:FAD-binding oxidoreductase n=1 Tax=Allosphingosinicella flava TaxID=2771430 RepID=A0A7T2GL69_9SPHN|nr:FAD-binding oxidoreductase [Sphingosinicella flava]QPQ55896.1 FAD-binding oxidoreductase [Sphingosinicella flava]
MTHYDVAIVGAGIAGASLAAEIAPHCSVLLLEAEAQPGYHATGRSAAFWSETYGGPLIQPLTTASGPFLESPPKAFHDGSFLHPRGCLIIADENGHEALAGIERTFGGGPVKLNRQGRAALQCAIPGLRRAWDAGLAEPDCRDIDVAALHNAYLRAARRSEARLAAGARLTGAERRGGAWHLEWRDGTARASILVNAAGAWADEVAAMAGVRQVGLQPYRRTMIQLRVDPPAPSALPLVMDARERFYFKPEAGGRLWLSPHDETPCPPCDSAPEEMDVARAIESLANVVDWRIEAVERKWAGLRTFAPDRLPVYGFADPGFFWFAGQGGFGIQTAPAAAKLGASLLLRTPPEAMVAGIDPAPYAAQRFMN